MTTTNTTWKYQHRDDSAHIYHCARTDSTGLKQRRDCGYTHVYMGQGDGCYDGWLQIDVAIAKLEIRERMAVFTAAVNQLCQEVGP